MAKRYGIRITLRVGVANELDSLLSHRAMFYNYYMDNEIIRVGSCADKRKTTTTCPKTFRNANKIQQCLRWRSQIEDFT